LDKGRESEKMMGVAREAHDAVKRSDKDDNLLGITRGWNKYELADAE
jgi:hypothetical protein